MLVVRQLLALDLVRLVEVDVLLLLRNRVVWVVVLLLLLLLRLVRVVDAQPRLSRRLGLSLRGLVVLLLVHRLRRELHRRHPAHPQR